MTFKDWLKAWKLLISILLLTSPPVGGELNCFLDVKRQARPPELPLESGSDVSWPALSENLFRHHYQMYSDVDVVQTEVVSSKDMVYYKLFWGLSSSPF